MKVFTIFLKPFIWLKEKYEEIERANKAEQEAKREKRRQDIRDFVNSELTEQQIEKYNITLIMNSAGWIGGNYTAAEIKLEILRSNKNFFEEAEYLALQERARQG